MDRQRNERIDRRPYVLTEGRTKSGLLFLVFLYDFVLSLSLFFPLSSSFQTHITSTPITARARAHTHTHRITHVIHSHSSLTQSFVRARTHSSKRERVHIMNTCTDTRYKWPLAASQTVKNSYFSNCRVSITASSHPPSLLPRHKMQKKNKDLFREICTTHGLH